MGKHLQAKTDPSSPVPLLEPWLAIALPAALGQLLEESLELERQEIKAV